ncbi:hypothetical protein Q7473_00600 [Glaesserella parasuis]|nr:hypothetical protein [Glaesserella parasuis]
MKLGLFFGAGAEISYGLPSGGRFAIELFRKDPTEYKKELRVKLQNINSRSVYANNWLPKDYQNKKIFAFGKNEFTTIIESSIQYKRKEIINFLNNFDSEFKMACNQVGVLDQDMRSKYHQDVGCNIGDILYGQDIILNKKLADEVKLFESEYFSSCLEVIKRQRNCDDLRRYIVAFLQLLVGAYGQEFVQNLNEELFESAPDDIPIFDDIFGMFRLEFDKVGSTALELLLNEKRSFDISGDANSIQLFSAVTQKILENLFAMVLDYQKLIDDHFRYLFSPQTEWAKFTKMVIFLEIAHKYITEQFPDILPNDGYYHDIKEIFQQGDNVEVIGTTNYNNIFQKVSINLGIPDIPVYHLNGSTVDFYNPYKNEVISSQTRDENEQILVPFMLTQSGLKPLTSVEMSRRYVELFDKLKLVDCVISIGFGFNKDDSHINGIFRELIEKHNKKVYIVTVSDKDTEKEIRKRLRIDKNVDNLKVILVDRTTRKKDDKFWFNLIELDDKSDK